MRRNFKSSLLFFLLLCSMKRGATFVIFFCSSWCLILYVNFAWLHVQMFGHQFRCCCEGIFVLDSKVYPLSHITESILAIWNWVTVTESPLYISDSKLLPLSMYDHYQRPFSRSNISRIKAKSHSKQKSLQNI